MTDQNTLIEKAEKLIGRSHPLRIHHPPRLGERVDFWFVAFQKSVAENDRLTRDYSALLQACVDGGLTVKDIVAPLASSVQIETLKAEKDRLTKSLAESEAGAAAYRQTILDINHESIQFGYNAVNSKIAALCRAALAEMAGRSILAQLAAAEGLRTAAALAMKHLQPDLVEPGRTVFWALVDAIAKFDQSKNPQPPTGE